MRSRPQIEVGLRSHWFNRFDFRHARVPASGAGILTASKIHTYIFWTHTKNALFPSLSPEPRSLPPFYLNSETLAAGLVGSNLLGKENLAPFLENGSPEEIHRWRPKE